MLPSKAMSALKSQYRPTEIRNKKITKGRQYKKEMAEREGFEPSIPG